jgi:predicted DNA-binding transcriptional regulator AlpA
MANDGDVLLTRRDVLATIGMRSTWLKAAVKSGEFPAPVRISNRSLFSRREVHAWIETRKAERGRAA